MSPPEPSAAAARWAGLPSLPSSSAASASTASFSVIPDETPRGVDDGLRDLQEELGEMVAMDGDGDAEEAALLREQAGSQSAWVLATLRESNARYRAAAAALTVVKAEAAGLRTQVAELRESEVELTAVLFDETRQGWELVHQLHDAHRYRQRLEQQILLMVPPPTVMVGPPPPMPTLASPTPIAGDPPGAYKTCLCQNWLQTGFCPFAAKCHFAHGPHEIRVAGPPEQTGHPPATYKTSLCRNWRSGSVCQHASNCVFAHGLGDLRPTPRGRTTEINSASSSDLPARRRQGRKRGGKALVRDPSP